MSKNRLEFEIGKKLPEEIRSSFLGPTIVYDLWIHPDFSIFLKDYRRPNDTVTWNISDIKLSVSVVNDIVFLIAYIKDFDLYIDVPYFPKKTPLSHSQVIEGPQYIHLFLMDETLLLHARRSFELSKDTQAKLGQLFKKQLERYDTLEVFDDCLKSIYAKYPDPYALMEANVMSITWEESPSVLN